jgi:cytidylate kinase
MVVAIDGPAGVGKSTIAAKCAARAGFLYINSGSFYRAITLAVLEAGAPPQDTRRVLAIARASRLDLRDGKLWLEDACVEEKIRSDAVEAWVARHSSVPEVREIINRRLREIAAGGDAVVEGRDIGTVVFPEADLKIFLEADVSTRAARRHAQGVSNLSLSAIAESIRERDSVDRSKPTGRLAAAKDALRIDTSHLTIDEVCERVGEAILLSKNNLGDTRRL